MIALLLDLWSALLLGILYLTFQAFPIIFGTVHHFSLQLTGVSFLGIGLGMVLGLVVRPFINRYVSSSLHLCQHGPDSGFLDGRGRLPRITVVFSYRKSV